MGNRHGGLKAAPTATGTQRPARGTRPAERRRGLSALLLSSLAIALPTTASGQDVFEFVPVAEGVYGSFVMEPHNPSQYSASLVIVNDDHVIVVDSRHSPEAAQALIDEIRSVTDRPVRYLVNSHWHGDHVYGNAVFRSTFPDVRIIGHPATIEAMQTDGLGRLEDERERTAERIERWTRWLGAGRTDDGQVLSADDSAQVGAALRQAEHRADQLDGVVLSPPDLAVVDSLVSRSGDRTVTIFHPGEAHTRGDLVVDVQPEGVLAVGDLIEDGYPYLDDGTVSGAATVLAALSERPTKHLFGAHARPLADRSLLDAQSAFLTALTRAVDDAVAEGLSVEEAVESIRLGHHRDGFTATVGTEAERFDGFVAGLVRLTYQERKAGPGT